MNPKPWSRQDKMPNEKKMKRRNKTFIPYPYFVAPEIKELRKKRTKTKKLKANNRNIQQEQSIKKVAPVLRRAINAGEHEKVIRPRRSAFPGGRFMSSSSCAQTVYPSHDRPIHGSRSYCGRLARGASRQVSVSPPPRRLTRYQCHPD